jgi:multidrug transporter EmrE-like cation transporter
MITLFNFNQYINPGSNQSWKSIAKVGAILVAIGLLIFMLKELIIGILSAIFIGLGVYFLIMAFNLWNSNRLY